MASWDADRWMDPVACFRRLMYGDPDPSLPEWAEAAEFLLDSNVSDDLKYRLEAVLVRVEGLRKRMRNKDEKLKTEQFKRSIVGAIRVPSLPGAVEPTSPRRRYWKKVRFADGS